MAINEKKAAELMALCHRRCCICHRFCGVKMELHHMQPKESGGSDDIDNIIAVCFECHAEIASYNDKHPRGRKFKLEELRLHKKQWLEICRDRPEVILNAARNADVGPLQALVDELEYNVCAAKILQPGDLSKINAMFITDQFKRAVSEGAIAVLDEDLKLKLLTAYANLNSGNESIIALINRDRGTQPGRKAQFKNVLTEIKQSVPEAHRLLLTFLGGEKESQ